jgi:hypothetical protein
MPASHRHLYIRTAGYSRLCHTRNRLRMYFETGKLAVHIITRVRKPDGWQYNRSGRMFVGSSPFYAGLILLGQRGTDE